MSTHQPSDPSAYDSWGSPPAQPMAAGAPIAKVPSHMAWAIVCTIFCFLPTGIAAIVYASQVKPKLQQGDIAGAVRSSAWAARWCWISLAILVILVLLTVASG